MAIVAEREISDINDERRKRVFVGELPPEFLRVNAGGVPTEQERQESADRQAAISLQHEIARTPYSPGPVGTLKLTILQAKLVKNYGLVRMDPYVRIRVGHGIYETNSDANGGRYPKWNRDILCLVPQGVTNIALEVFDECSFSLDELIAFTNIPIPRSIMRGETIEQWYPLSGRQGEGLEGSINIVLSFTQMGQSGYFPAVGGTPLLSFPQHGGITGFRQVLPFGPSPVAPISVAPPQPSAEDVKLIEDMFPNIEKDVIKSVYEVNRFQKNQTVYSLLQMAE